MAPVFALVDCNNFYASCEKLFRPDLKRRPVVVLSNNDGCIVARSAEAKALGFKMGQPFFQAREQIERQGVVVFSSNYALYADISNRVMSLLEQLAPRVEIYSIDEAFLDLSGITDLLSFGIQVRSTVHQWTGIQVCVGIAPTKTLAKLANHAAKQYPATGGVVDLTDRQRQLRLMKLMPVQEVWGVGPRLAAQLNSMGIKTALDLARSDSALIRKRFSVVLERTLAELNGISCLELEDVQQPRQQIICSRSFGQKITDFQQMREAIFEYGSRAAERLRQDQLLAKHVGVFIRSSGFNPVGKVAYSNMASTGLAVPTVDTRQLLAVASDLLQSIWREGYRYDKGGVMLSDFFPARQQQQDLFADSADPRRTALMRTVDQINRSGKGRIFLASQGIKQEWAMQRKYLSPAYTTRWSDIPVVK